MPTPAERKETLKSNAAWGEEFKSLQHNKGFKRILEQLEHEEATAVTELLVCRPEEIEKYRQRAVAFKYISAFVDKQVRRGDKAKQELEGGDRKE